MHIVVVMKFKGQSADIYELKFIGIVLQQVSFVWSVMENFMDAA